MNEERYFARSASDRTDDWPFWFVADRTRGGLNVTLELFEAIFGDHLVGLPFMSADDARMLAELASMAPAQPPAPSAGGGTAVRPGS